MTALKAANKLLYLWQEYGPDQSAVDLGFIVEELINRSSNGDRLSIAERHLPNIDGAMVRSTLSETSYTAMVNSAIENSGRRRFTLGHEIGHFVLHRRVQKEFSCTRAMLEDFNTEGFEQEANQFAAQLLLPPNRVREHSERSWNLTTLKDVAEEFEVSLQAAALRIVQLSKRPIAFVVSTSDFVEWGISSPKLFKQGCYFKQMDEVPSCSTAFAAEFSDERLERTETLSEAWRINETFKETSMAGYDGRVYTLIEVV